jgi:cobaltochelatase CobN
VHDALIADEKVMIAMAEANPAAAEAIASRMEDLIARSLWVPRRNAVHAELARLRAAASTQRVSA